MQLKLEEQFNWLQQFVSSHGTLLLTRGMTHDEANEALIACLKAFHGDEKCPKCKETRHVEN